MNEFTLPKYDDCKEWIREKKEEEYSWDDIRSCCVQSENSIEAFEDLKLDMIVPLEMTMDEWILLVSSIENSYIEVSQEKTVNGIYLAENLKNYAVPSGQNDAWVKYEKKLKGELDGKRQMSDESVKNIRENGNWVLNRLRKETRECGPQKGLVMGSVQSGKTANMIGIVTQAAHYDWNFIIVLSGTIDNLRDQTTKRFMKDLPDYCTDVSWHFLKSTSNEDFLFDIKNNCQISLREAKFGFSEPYSMSRDRFETYVMVCLKQASRLRKLLHWLHSDPNVASRMRLLIIDDEADQASVNTAKMTDTEVINRTTINQLIINLANGADENGEQPRSSFQAINYVSFTATPYANVLNEAYRESLYPKDFVMCLPENNSYFGAKVIFGSKKQDDYPGMNIIREVDKKSADLIDKKICKGIWEPIPQELQEAIAWFLCCVAVLRTKRWKKPISMLIHTSIGNEAHFMLYEAIKIWYECTRDDSKKTLLSICERVYERETKQFTYEGFKESYSCYEDLNSMDKYYPAYEVIKDELILLLKQTTKKIQLVEDGLSYSGTGLHVCVDNCKAKKYDDDEDTQLRIKYPDDEELEQLEKAPAFIVIGGNTLSRGLTIEGLVCTFFTRNSNQADTLMQMARWYGYRKGYELLPRIWMTKKAIDKFKLLEQVDEKLRDTLEMYRTTGKDPSKFGPAVMSTSAIAKFLLTAKNKSQNMVTCDMDFSGDSYEVTEFCGSNEIAVNNLKVTEMFLLSLGEPENSKVNPDNSYIWRGVNSEKAIKYITEYQEYKPSNFTDQMQDFLKWMKTENEKGLYLHWNVAVCGSSTYRGSKWKIEGLDPLFGKVNRTKYKTITSHIDIGSMRSGKDGICDIDIDENTDMSVLSIGKRGKDIEWVRGKLGYSDIPLLLIYCLSKNGGKETDNKCHLDSGIDLENDVIAYSVIIGGELANTDHISSVVVNIPAEEDDDEAEE